MVRVGILGLGKIAQTHHIPNLRRMSDVTIACLSDLTISHCRSVASRFEVQGAAMVLPEHVPWAELDALFILNRHHAPVIQTSLSMGIPCFVEKPVCWRPAEVRALRPVVDAVRTEVSTVGYMKRYVPDVQSLLRDARAEGVGDFCIKVRAGGLHKAHEGRPLRPVGVERNERTEERVLGLEPTGSLSSVEIQMERTVIELGIHSINLARVLAGPSCELVTAAHDVASGEVTIDLRHRSGLGRLYLKPDFHEAREWEDHVVADVGGRTRELTFANPFVATRSRSSELSIASAFQREVHHFISAVRGDVETVTPVSEGLDDVTFAFEVIDQIRSHV